MTTVESGPAIVPPRLRAGDQVRVVAPSRSLAMIGSETRRIADERLASLGLQLTFGSHVEVCDAFVSSSVRARVDDLHDAFADDEVAAILTVIGGFNSNQLLPRLDWDHIAAHPKVFCGFSDITALQNAMLARSGLVTYSGPHYSSFGMRDHVQDTVNWFVDCLFRSEPIRLSPASRWSDDLWYVDQDRRELLPNEGWWIIQEGAAEGQVVGGNAVTFAMLNGTPYQPELAKRVLVLEDDEEARAHHFDRSLTSILQQPGGGELAGILVGRFQRASEIDRSLLTSMIQSKREIADIPVVANIDIGHTSPMVTFPIGGQVAIDARSKGATITITEH